MDLIFLNILNDNKENRKESDSLQEIFISFSPISLC